MGRDEGGPWTAAEHLGDPQFDGGLAYAILKHVPFRSVLDVGCGLGFYLKEFFENGRISVGVEPRDYHPHWPVGPTFRVLDPSKPGQHTKPLFDLVMCLEVAEHVRRDHHPALFDFLCGSGRRWLVFSGATPNQGGHGHVAERPQTEWGNEIADRGFSLDEPLTHALRDAATLPWFKRNLLVHERRGGDNADPT